MVTIKQIARLAGVSSSTVVNVLHGRSGKAGVETSERVRQVLRETNYVPNMGARILKTRGSRLIGVVLTWSRRAEQNAVQDPFYGELIGALEQEIRAAGYFMLLYTALNAEECMKMAGSWNVEALILLGCQKDDCSRLMRSAALPIVFIDAYFNDDGLPYTCVGLEDRKGSFMLTEYLIARGHTRIAFLADKAPPEGTDHERLEGFRAAMRKHGLPAGGADFISISYKQEERRAFLRAFANGRARHYSALCFSSDFYAVDALVTFYDEGILVPRDISICGFDGNIFASQCRPRLTTVKQNVTEKAVIAAAQALRLIHKEQSGANIIRLGVALAEGESVRAMPPTPSPSRPRCPI
ncbi:MAG: LacI family transcriptional regulator [Treponema sp.]|jgi:LacI family transcriptional regulator|nr:LacI family transcriptional regulator [Treponema sp.]